MKMIKEIIAVGSYGVNCTILTNGYVVDPGAEADSIIKTVGTHVAGIILTHAHFDHIGAIEDLQKRWPDLKVYVGADDRMMFGHPMNCCPPEYTVCTVRNVEDIQKVPIQDLTIIPTPGHTPGSVSLYFANEGILLSGDTLFSGSIGRTDFPGGDAAAMMRSLRTLATLPDDTVVIPGHGPTTTIAAEKRYNQFLSATL